MTDTDFLISIITTGYPLLQKKDERTESWKLVCKQCGEYKPCGCQQPESDEDLRDYLSAEDSQPECEWCGEKLPYEDLVEIEGLLRCARCRSDYSIRWGRP